MSLCAGVTGRHAGRPCSPGQAAGPGAPYIMSDSTDSTASVSLMLFVRRNPWRAACLYACLQERSGCGYNSPCALPLLSTVCVPAVQPISSDAALAAASVHFRRWTAQGHIPGSCRVTCSLVEAGQGKQFCSSSLLCRWCLM